MPIAFADISKIFDDNGCLQKPHKLSNDIKVALASIKVRHVSLGEGEIEYVTEYKLINKLSALEKLAKHIGFYERHLEQKTTPLSQIIKDLQGTGLKL